MKNDTHCDVPGCMKKWAHCIPVETTKEGEKFRSYVPGDIFCDDHVPEWYRLKLEEDRRRREERKRASDEWRRLANVECPKCDWSGRGDEAFLIKVQRKEPLYGDVNNNPPVTVEKIALRCPKCDILVRRGILRCDECGCRQPTHYVQEYEKYSDHVQNHMIPNLKIPYCAEHAPFGAAEIENEPIYVE